MGLLDAQTQRLSIVTNSPDEATAWYADTYRGVAITDVHGGDRFTLDVKATAWADASVAAIEIGPAVEVTDLSESGDFVAFDVLSGRYRYELGQDDIRIGAGDIGLITNDGDPRITTVDLKHRLVCVKRPIMLEVVEAWTGEKDVRFTGFSPVSEEAGRSYLRALGNLQRIADDPYAADESLMVCSGIRHLAASMLICFPNTAMTARAKPAGQVTCTGTSRAVEFIKANYMREISALDIARAADMHPRALAGAFRARFDMTPTEYLRQERLSWAHDQLRQADPATTKISAIARRCGWISDSKFAAAYRKVYGYPPSQTLRAS